MWWRDDEMMWEFEDLKMLFIFSAPNPWRGLKSGMQSDMQLIEVFLNLGDKTIYPKPLKGLKEWYAKWFAIIPGLWNLGDESNLHPL